MYQKLGAKLKRISNESKKPKKAGIKGMMLQIDTSVRCQKVTNLAIQEE
jgi:hypothetical protein